MGTKITNLTRFKNWLDNNKVFFEAITAILLSVMSLTVSINANQIAEYQNEIAEYQNYLVKEQNQLIKDENQPIFEFKLIQFNNSTLNTAEKIDIYNNGTSITNFQAEAYVLCDVQLHNYGFIEGVSKISFYQNCYYDAIPTGSSQGLMSSFESTGFLSSLSRYLDSTHLPTEFNSYLQNQSNFEQVQLIRYVHITYSDIYGENHDEVYRVTKIGSFKLSDAEKIVLSTELDCFSYAYDPDYSYPQTTFAIR